MNKNNDSAQHLDVLVVPDAEILRTDASLGKHGGCLSQHQSGATNRATPEMNEMPVVSVSVAARILTHRRDEHPIGKRQISNRKGIKQAGHDRKSEVGSHRSEISNPNATYEQSSIHPDSRCRVNRGGIDSTSSLIAKVEAGCGVALARTRTSGRFVCCCSGRLVPS